MVIHFMFMVKSYWPVVKHFPIDVGAFLWGGGLNILKCQRQKNLPFVSSQQTTKLGAHQSKMWNSQNNTNTKFVQYDKPNKNGISLYKGGEKWPDYQ